MIVAADGTKKENQHGDKDDGDPSALSELREQYHDYSDTGDKGAEAIYKNASLPMRATPFEPVDDHTGLREREGQESAHRVKRDKTVSYSTKENKQQAGESGENDNSVGINEAAAAICKGMR